LCDCEIKDLLIKFWYSWIFANTAKLYQVKDIITQSTVNASNPKSQKILKNSLSNHLDKLIDTDIPLKPTSKKRIKAIIVVKITPKEVII